MRKGNFIIKVFFLCMAFFINCKKGIKDTYKAPLTDSSHISITNISPSISDLCLYLNNKFFPLPDSPIVYGKTVFASYIRNPTTYFPDTVMLPYINILPGYQQLDFGSYRNSNIFGELNNNFEPGASYSLFLTDTAIHGKVAQVLLKDNIRPADSIKSQIRFLNLSPDAPPLDVWAYPNAGYSGYKIFSGCAYIPNDFDSFINAESFSDIDPGIYYFEAAVAGTTNVLLGGYLVIFSKRVITIYTKGYVSAIGVKAIDVGIIQYAP